MFFLALGIFSVLLIARVESWGARLILAAVVGALYFLVGSLAAMVAASALSVGILIQSQLPTISGM